MTALFRTQRRAEHFDALLERGLGDGGVDRQTAELLELVGALREMPAPQARPEFVADLRERLMVAAEAELTTVPADRRRDDVARLTIKPHRTRRERRFGVALGAVAIIGATTSMAVASQSAIPGDALYPLKRAIENTQTGISVSDEAKGRTMLGNASGRLDELQELTNSDQPDPALVTQTLDTFSAQFSEAGDLLIADYQENGHAGSIRQLHAAAADSLDVLAGLAPSVPAAAHDALLSAAAGVFALDAAAEQACPDPACGDAVTEAPPQLVAGVANAVDDATDALAGGQLPGTVSPSDDAGFDQQGDGGKDEGEPSGLNPPESPIVLPSVPPTAPGDESGTGGLGGLLPGVGTQTSGGSVGGQGGDTQGGNGGKGGKGGKNKPVDLAPVTDTVNEVVNGVVEGVNGLLGGLTGGLTGGQTGGQ